MFLNWNVSSRNGEEFKMSKKFNEVLKDLSNKFISLFNKQEMKFFVKKGGEWKTATKMDLLFFNNSEFVDVLPRKRGDLLQSNTWQGLILAVFIANKNSKDIGYVNAQLADAERMAPVWLQKNSNMVE